MAAQPPMPIQIASVPLCACQVSGQTRSRAPTHRARLLSPAERFSSFVDHRPSTARADHRESRRLQGVSGERSVHQGARARAPRTIRESVAMTADSDCSSTSGGAPPEHASRSSWGARFVGTTGCPRFVVLRGPSIAPAEGLVRRLSTRSPALPLERQSARPREPRWADGTPQEAWGAAIRHPTVSRGDVLTPAAILLTRNRKPSRRLEGLKLASHPLIACHERGRGVEAEYPRPRGSAGPRRAYSVPDERPGRPAADGPSLAAPSGPCPRRCRRSGRRSPGTHPAARRRHRRYPGRSGSHGRATMICAACSCGMPSL